MAAFIDLTVGIEFFGRGGTASLDRIDNHAGYVSGNVQWLHKDVNQMKMDFDEAYFIQLCASISRYKGL